MRSMKSQRIINIAIKQNNNLTNGVRTGYSDLSTKSYVYYVRCQKYIEQKFCFDEKRNPDMPLPEKEEFFILQF